jgi:hypothetical protein
MRRDQMEHILRAASSITNEREFVVLGSQALLAAFPELGAPLDKSMDLDIYPLHQPDAAALIDGTIGELSPFDETFGYYAHGIGPETAIMPSGWRNRSIRVQNENTGGACGICISPEDLALSKLAAGREKDLSFVSEMIRRHLVAPEKLGILLDEVEVAHRDAVRERLVRLVSAGSKSGPGA